MAVVVVLPWVPATAMTVCRPSAGPRNSDAFEHRDAGCARGLHFRVIVRDGGGAHHQVGAGDMFGAM